MGSFDPRPPVDRHRDTGGTRGNVLDGLRATDSRPMPRRIGLAAAVKSGWIIGSPTRLIERQPPASEAGARLALLSHGLGAAGGEDAVPEGQTSDADRCEEIAEPVSHGSLRARSARRPRPGRRAARRASTGIIHGFRSRWSHHPDLIGVSCSRVFIPGGQASNSSFRPGLIEHANDVGEVLACKLRVDDHGLNVGGPKVGLDRSRLPPAHRWSSTPRPWRKAWGWSSGTPDAAPERFHELPDPLTEDSSLDDVTPAGAIADDKERGTRRCVVCR